MAAASKPAAVVCPSSAQSHSLKTSREATVTIIALSFFCSVSSPERLSVAVLVLREYMHAQALLEIVQPLAEFFPPEPPEVVVTVQ